MLTSAHRRWSPMTRQSFSMNNRRLVEYVLPCLIQIFQPNIKTVNLQLMRKEDRNTLAEVVNIMVSLKMTYKSRRLEDGRVFWNFDP